MLDIAKRGWLKKKQPVYTLMSHWQDRFFVLRENILHYYEQVITRHTWHARSHAQTHGTARHGTAQNITATHICRPVFDCQRILTRLQSARC